MTWKCRVAVGVPVVGLVTAVGILILGEPSSVKPSGKVVTPTLATVIPTVGTLSVSANQLLANGRPVVLHGVNRSGTEYACVQFGGPFDGPSDQASVAAIVAWHVNAVRVPLNEDCWLGINGQPVGGLTAQQYQHGIEDYVSLLHANGLYVILELHWSAPGNHVASYQTNLPDYDHSLALWASVASAFKGDGATVFDLFNEPNDDGQHCGSTSPKTCFTDPHQNWWCWSHGQGCVTNHNPSWGTWRIAGMEELIGAVRSTGASNVVMAGGLQHANDMSRWLAYRPSDPASQLAASFHLYNFNGCNSVSCWDAQVAPVAAVVPLVTGEIGETDGRHSFIDRYTAWADPKRIGYLGWTWNAWGCDKGAVLIADYTGTPCQTFGSGFQAHLAGLSATG